MQKNLNTYHYFLLNKPYGYLSQFTGEHHDLLLGQLFPFPKGVYPVGRLDKTSEGLLLLTNDNAFKHKILSPIFKSPKTYWVQVEGNIPQEAIDFLKSGKIPIKHKGKIHIVATAVCKKIAPPPVDDRIPPIRSRATIPTSWIELTISEGKNRQVRKMTAAVGFPTLRLIRFSVADYTIEGLPPGGVKRIYPINK